MSKWTPTPWTGHDIYVSGADDFVVVEFDTCSYPEDGINKARLIACVNAFHSPDGREIATEKISEGLVWEMVEALRRAVDGIEMTAKFMEDDDELSRLKGTIDGIKYDAAPARALLAKLEE